MQPIKTTDLVCITPLHNKFYTVQLSEENGLYYLDGISGAIGGNPKTQKKLAGVDLVTATDAFDKLVREKSVKGDYKLASQAAPAVQLPPPVTPALPIAAPVSNLPGCQLLNPITLEGVEQYLSNSVWLAQPKHDGDRCRISISTSGQVIGTSRKHLPMALPMSVVTYLKERFAGHHLELDGELVEGTTYFCFDLLRANDIESWEESAEKRSLAVKSLFPLTTGPVQGIETGYTTEEKRAIWVAVKSKGMEGIIFKLKSAHYTADRPTRGGPAVKYKALSEGSVICTGQRGVKRSVGIKLFDGRDLGAVTIGKGPIPEAGQILDVSTLYLHNKKGGKLSIAQFLRVRHDIAPEACVASQFRLKDQPEEEN